VTTDSVDLSIAEASPDRADAQADGVTHRLLNRELSWLDFNDRVLSLAAEPGIPLLERAKFCAITSTNLDEFWQVRVAGLRDQIAAGFDEITPDGRTPLQQISEITCQVKDQVARQEQIFTERLVPELAERGVMISMIWSSPGSNRSRPWAMSRAASPGDSSSGR